MKGITTMAYIFDKSLETGNHLIDTQHRELIKAINDLLDACKAGKGRDKICSTGKYMAEYTAKHFGDEEVLQNKAKYPDYPNHKKLHEGFKKDIAEVNKELAAEGPTIAAVAKMNAKAAWLINHIKTQDVRLAKHLASQSQ